jgi:hypothetical protein
VRDARCVKHRHGVHSGASWLCGFCTATATPLTTDDSKLSKLLIIIIMHKSVIKYYHIG